LADEPELIDRNEYGPAKEVLYKERGEILARAIDALPDKERTVVSFYYFEDLTMREMADAMHLTEGRISQLHSQAMIRLRTLLQDTRSEITLDA
jgi:RNA polymerase sigma factor for flagellar operon FliA